MVDRLLYPVMMFSVVIALTSCGKADVKKVSSQIAAKVNGDEISVHQINSAIARSNDIPPEEAQAGGRPDARADRRSGALGGEGAQGQADRDPQVMQSIEDAKRQILARLHRQSRGRLVN